VDPISTNRSPGPTDAGTSGPSGSSPDLQRRSYWIAGIALFGTIAALVTITILTTSSGPRQDTQGQQRGAKPHIIPRPGEGRAPEHPNDRGGWEQYLVLGLMVTAIATIGGLVWRSSRRARARSAAAPPRESVAADGSNSPRASPT
jgi:hypothetical protein